MLFLKCSCGNLRPMNEKYDRPVSHGDLLLTVEMALRKAGRSWPKKRVPGDHDRLRPVAEAVLADLERCGMRVFQRPPRPPHSIPDPWGALRQDGESDGTDS